MRRAFGHVDRVVGWISRGFAGVAGALVGFITLLIGADVIGRALGSPVRGTVALSASAVVAVAFLALPYTMRRQAHVRSSLIHDRVGDRGKRVIDTLAYGLAAAAFVLIAVSSWDRLVNAWVIGEYTGEGSLRVPSGPTRTILFTASILMAVECAIRLAKSLVPSLGTDDE